MVTEETLNKTEEMYANRKVIIDKCEGCERVDVEKKCNAYIDPSAKWRLGPCPLATHVTVDSQGTSGKVRVGQQKSKKKSRKK
jgi:hypothetical protein